MTDAITAVELTDPSILKLLGHGTNGSDGIESGIHLRWAFNHKLGFPACVKLYRRRSFMQNQYVWDYLAQAEELLVLPSTHQILSGLHEFDFHFESTPGVTAFPIVAKSSGPRKQNVVYILDGQLDIDFKVPVSRIELGFLVETQSEFQIVVKDPTGAYYPQAVSGTFRGWKDIYFDASGAIGLRLFGKEINLAYLAVWICSDAEADPWQEIKLVCGCGLPLTPSTKPAPNQIDETAVAIDPAKIDCRLELAGGISLPFTRDDILEVSKLLPSIVSEGVAVPHGWTLFPTDGAQSGAETGTEVSIYDYLLAQSLYVPVAKVLDLYYVDRPQDPDRYFDYRIETMWSEWNVRQLSGEVTFDTFETGQHFENLFSIAGLYLLDAGSPEIVAAHNPSARTELGLALNDSLPVTVLRFLQPVSEVQIWLLNPDEEEVVVTAHQDYYVTYKDKRSLQGTRGFVRLHADRIDSIRIAGSHVVLSRLHYDTETAPYFWQSTSICGVKRGTNPYPLEKPSGLAVSFMTGGPVNSPDRTYAEVPYLAGMRWETNAGSNRKLTPQHPFAYHVERRSADGSTELLTEDAPLLISPDTGTSTTRLPKGWPAKRQYYIDHVDSSNPRHYRIRSLDLFGRQSPFGDYETYTIMVSPPPAPTQVTAHYLDYGTYDPATETFRDPGLLEVDKAWLKGHPQSGLVVRWQWPQELAEAAPDVAAFRIFLQPGWLNTYVGSISSEPVAASVEKSSLNLTQSELNKYRLLDTYEDIPTWTLSVRMQDGARFDQDALRFSWLRQNSQSFLIFSNTAGAMPTLQVLRFEQPVETRPSQSEGFSISITADGPAFVDYGLPGSWANTTALEHLEPKHASPLEQSYTVYLPAVSFPVPAVTLHDPLRYGQVGVCAVAKAVEGGVSTPATILAVYQNPPPAPATALVLPSYRNLAVLKATPADVHGKSTFAVRWRRSGDGVHHFVYRCMNTTLFMVDNARRLGGDSADYTAFDSPKYDPADVDAVRQIRHVAGADDVLAQYAQLSASQLFILANLAENTAAYTRLHSQPIYEGDAAYQDRDTDIPDALGGATYVPDADVLLYSDSTLDGRGRNRYFYRVQTTASNGLRSDFGESTPPVEAPRTTPPPRPVITAISGGDSQITVGWARNAAADIVGYLLYRTQDKRHATDWRRMRLVKANAADAFTVSVTPNLPQRDLEFTDSEVIAGQPYYYAVVAASVTDSGKPLKSTASAARSGQAFDLTAPKPPEFLSLERVARGARQTIAVRWMSREPASFLLKRSEQGSKVYHPIGDWIGKGTYHEDTDTWHYAFEDEQNVRSDTRYAYQVVAKDRSGNLSSSDESGQV